MPGGRILRERHEDLRERFPFQPLPPHVGNVTRWRDAGMAERWVASAWLLTEKRFRRVDGHQDLWSLAAILGRETAQRPSEKERVA